MRRSLKHNPRARWLAAVLLACPVLWGCGPPSARDLPLDKALAKQSLTAALDAWKAGEKAAIVHETADLWFHCLVMLGRQGVPVAEVLAELERREGRSGIEEKASRQRGDAP